MDGWTEIFSLAWTVPLILDSMMTVAISVYDYFVGGGIIYAIIWGWLAFSIGLYLIKMYFPKHWLELFGLSGGGEMLDPKTTGWTIANDVLKPMLRAMFAVIILLQVKPQYITNFIVDPFLEFGAVYVDAITHVVLPEAPMPDIKCPTYLGDYMSQESCEFLVRPIHEVSRLNNSVIERGLGFIMAGFAPLGIGGGFLSVITGLILVSVFFSSNLFMALLIIQGIFKLGLSLILYPFKVLVYVVKTPNDPNLWINPWPALDDLIKSLQKLVIAMIAVAFILLINVSVVGALFGLDTAKDGDIGFMFGSHSVTWLVAIMTFLVMFKVFDLTRKQLEKYVSDAEMTGLYDRVSAGAKNFYKNTTEWGKRAIKILAAKEEKK